MKQEVINVVIAGLGGQGVIRSSDILAEAAFLSGFDVKKSEIHGMSQRGGSVFSDVRFGSKIWSPVISPGEADYLIILSESEADINRPRLKKNGKLLSPLQFSVLKLQNPKMLNTLMLGYLSRELPISAEAWTAAFEKYFTKEMILLNSDTFNTGRNFNNSN